MSQSHRESQHGCSSTFLKLEQTTYKWCTYVLLVNEYSPNHWLKNEALVLAMILRVESGEGTRRLPFLPSNWPLPKVPYCQIARNLNLKLLPRNQLLRESWVVGQPTTDSYEGMRSSWIEGTVNKRYGKYPPRFPKLTHESICHKQEKLWVFLGQGRGMHVGVSGNDYSMCG